MTRSIFDAAGRAALARYVRDGALLAFDFDGTLAPIVENPDAATMRPTTRRLLERLAALHPTAVISGRSRADCARRLAGIPLVDWIGNHGLESRSLTIRAPHIVHRWREQLARTLATVPGVAVEDKEASLAIHYRRAEDTRAAEAIARDAVGRLTPRPRVVGGKFVLNLLPTTSVNKGSALVALMRSLRIGSAVYLGDDDTDEDAFGAVVTDDVLGIRVEASEASRATFHVPSQLDVDDLLECMLDLSSPDTPPLV